MAITTQPHPMVKPDTLYLGDNGRLLCGQHLGASAKYSGRDLSGQEIMAVTPDMVAEAEAEGWTLACEQCGKRASRLHSL